MATPSNSAVHSVDIRVLAGVAAPLFDDGYEIGLQLLRAVHAVPAALGCESHAGDELDDPAVPGGHLPPVLSVQTEDIEGHVDGEGFAEIVDEVHPASGKEGGHEFSGVGVDGAYLLLKGLAGETPDDDLSLGGVLGPGHLGEDGPAHHRLGAHLQRLGSERLMVGKYPLDVLVAGEEVAVDRRLVVHRSLLPQLCGVAVGVCGEVLGQDAETGIDHGHGEDLSKRADASARG
ncbi:hypothetical protein [Streptomyces sp. NBC_01481]|uniref:hypothetical protein n=1 Tax=Streptomyces sp. NBC_01481 TaxID=2975869 RepID=UPI002B1CCBDD|nr:hypothetical protein [Streptomyces sp. NBC_01481]